MKRIVGWFGPWTIYDTMDVAVCWSLLGWCCLKFSWSGVWSGWFRIYNALSEGLFGVDQPTIVLCSPWQTLHCLSLIHVASQLLQHFKSFGDLPTRNRNEDVVMNPNDISFHLQGAAHLLDGDAFQIPRVWHAGFVQRQGGYFKDVVLTQEVRCSSHGSILKPIVFVNTSGYSICILYSNTVTIIISLILQGFIFKT